ncbi:MAG: PHP domain-containing protein [Acetanaerobacterium sp.]
MEQLAYDLHIHSCLSPCADDDNTPNNILNMARLNGLDVIALTDHNSCKNCPAIMSARDRMGTPLLVLPGMELCCSEEIHIVCLFDTLDKAMAFDRYVYPTLPLIEGSPEKFGSQLILDAFDENAVTEHRLLVTASSIPITEIGALMLRFGGTAFPAHIDRASYSILSSLGQFPPECTFAAAEISDPARYEALYAAHAPLRRMRIVTNSDAHYLWDISEGERHLSLPARTAGAVIDYLSGR